MANHALWVAFEEAVSDNPLKARAMLALATLEHLDEPERVLLAMTEALLDIEATRPADRPKLAAGHEATTVAAVRAAVAKGKAAAYLVPAFKRWLERLTRLQGGVGGWWRRQRERFAPKF